MEQQRSVRVAVPIALLEALGADLDDAQLERVAQIIFAEIAARYRVAAGATLLTMRPDVAANLAKLYPQDRS